MKSFLVKSVLAVCITVFCVFYLDIMYEQNQMILLQKLMPLISSLRLFRLQILAVHMANMLLIGAHLKIVVLNVLISHCQVNLSNMIMLF